METRATGRLEELLNRITPADLEHTTPVRRELILVLKKALEGADATERTGEGNGKIL